MLNTEQQQGIYYSFFNSLICRTNVYVRSCFVYRAKVASVAKTTAVSTLTSSAHTNHQQSDRKFSRASHNVAITVLYTLIIHVIAWSGNQVQVLMTSFGFVVDTSSSLYQILLLATYCTSCVNPVVYVIKYKEFRRAINKFVLYRRTTVDVLQLNVAGTGVSQCV